METNKDRSADERQKTVSITRTFDLPLSTVWKAWSEPESFKKWWGPKNYTCPHCSIFFKVGGKCVASMKGEDGKEIWSTGTYKVIIPYKKIVLTDNFSDSRGNVIPPPADMKGEWADTLMIKLDFGELDGKTKLSLKHEGIPVEQYDECTQGWQESFDKLAKIK